MPLSWNEIKDRALKFSREWADEASEDAEAKSFLDDFFNVFGVPRRRVATFETRVKKIDGKDGYIDLLWKGILLIEQKSRGKDLDRAFQQAKGYFPGIQDRDLPRYILVSDFARFRLYDLEEGGQHEFTLKEFYKNIRLFGFVAGYQATCYKEQDPVNIKAAERMGKLHDKLKAIGYTGHELEVYLVRLLFCLFAEDTSIFERRQFQDLIEQRTGPDGQDLAQWLGHLFEVLNTPGDQRLKNLDEHLAAFPYVNGSLFAEHLHTAAFDRDMRDLLLDCCALDWGRISPAIFGALFQSVMDPQQRRHLGAHYTSEKNILKLIKPLFLDELRAEFDQVKGNRKKLAEFHQRLASLKFLDPACGCGNFLVIAYRELRELELALLRVLHRDKSQLLDVKSEILCNVNQFYGIELEEFPAQIAQTAMWLMDHQMNLMVSEEFGQYFSRLPLTTSATIVHANALQRDWREIVPPRELNYILGNPPFGGAKYINDEQRADMAAVFPDVPSAGLLDFVAAWYRKAADYMAENPFIKTAFVSTNSITQGEQVGVLWTDLLRRGVKIHFAHRTFQWSSEARGKAAVHCVIIGFGLDEAKEKRLFDYETPQSEAHEIKVKNINPYLVDAPDLVIHRRSTPLCSVPAIGIGNKPIDGGHYLFNQQERDEFLQKEPAAAPYFRRWIGADEFLNGYERWCLWLGDCSPNVLQQMPEARKRIEAVQRFRLASKSAPTRKLASTPTRFHVENMPVSNFLVIPEVSSERRSYIPLGFMTPETFCSNKLRIFPDATLYHFGVLSSAMHMGWTRHVTGRLKSDYQYSVSIVYNNFPWPQHPTDKQKQAIEAAAQAVLEARAHYPESSLADLYDPLTMPPPLVQAHRKLDAAVDAAYGRRKFTGDRDRLAFLFELYQQILSPLSANKNLRRKKAG
jgi:hypothetical protein